MNKLPLEFHAILMDGESFDYDMVQNEVSFDISFTDDHGFKRRVRLPFCDTGSLLYSIRDLFTHFEYKIFGNTISTPKVELRFVKKNEIEVRIIPFEIELSSFLKINESSIEEFNKLLNKIIEMGHEFSDVEGLNTPPYKTKMVHRHGVTQLFSKEYLEPLEISGAITFKPYGFILTITPDQYIKNLENFRDDLMSKIIFQGDEEDKNIQKELTKDIDFGKAWIKEHGDKDLWEIHQK